MKLTLGFAFRFFAPIAALSFTFVGRGLCAPLIAALSFTFVGRGLCAPLIAALSFTFVGRGLCAPPIAALSFTFVGWGLCAPLIADMCVGIKLGQTQQEQKNTKTRPIPYAACH